VNYRFTEADAEEGRRLLRACAEREQRDAKAELFYDWVHDQLGVTRSVAKEKFGRYFQHDLHANALRVLDAVIAGHNPAGNVLAKVVLFVMFWFVVLGLLGGVVYLFGGS
jgi:hypothetical protein